MMSVRGWSLFIAVGLIAVAGCKSSSSQGDAGVSDSGSFFDGGADAGAPDAGLDAGSGDAGADAGTPDAGSTTTYKYFLYVLTEHNTGVHGHEISLADGSVASASKIGTTGSDPRAIAVLPSGKFLYVANHGDNTLSIFSIASNGDVTAAGTAPTDAGPTGLAASPDGRFLFVVTEGANSLQSFKVDGGSGALTAAGSKSLAPGLKAVAVHPNGQFVYSYSNGDRTITTYSLNSTTGALTVVGTPAASGDNIDVMKFDPSGQHLYASGGPDALYAYSVDTGSGALTAVTGSPYLSSQNAYVYDLTLDPAGKYLFAADGNRTNTLYGFSVDATGSLTALTGSPFAVPSYITALNAVGPYLVALDSSGAKVNVFTLDSSGAITAVAGSPFSICVTPSHGVIARVPQP